MKHDANWYAENCLKPPKKFFDWCYSQIHTFKWSNKKKTILGSDRKNCKVIEKRLTKSSKLTFHDEFHSFNIVLVTSRRIEIQTYCFWSEFIDGKQTITKELTNLECLMNDEHIKVGRWWNHYGFGLVPLVSCGGPYTGVKHYENDWQLKVIKVSKLRYIDFSETDALYRFHLHHLYKYRNEIEFLQKINAITIADQVMHGHSIDYRTFNQTWLRKNKHLLKNNQKTFNAFELERRIRERGGKVVPGIDKYMIYSDLNVIPKGIGIVRFQNWVIKNKVCFSYYRDYLSLLKDLNLTPDNENLIIPKDLAKAHDNAVGLLNKMKRDVESRKFEKRIKNTLKYETTIGAYTFIVPKSMNDIIFEGKQLHHCVGGSNYINRHESGKTTIIFVRRTDTPNTPFFTMEYRSKSIIQLRGKHNQDAPEEVRAAADKWLEWVKKGCKKDGKKEVKDKKEKQEAA